VSLLRQFVGKGILRGEMKFLRPVGRRTDGVVFIDRRWGIRGGHSCAVRMERNDIPSPMSRYSRFSGGLGQRRPRNPYQLKTFGICFDRPLRGRHKKPNNDDVYPEHHPEGQ